MTDDILIAYVRDELSAGERAAVEGTSGVAGRLARLTTVHAALREPSAVVPPVGLSARTLAAVVVEIPPTVPSKRVQAGRGDGPLFMARRRADIIVAAGIGFLAFGLVMGMIQRSRHEATVRECQNTMRVLYASLDGYSQTHNGRYPQVGVAGAPTAGAFATKLAEAGFPTPDTAARCPSVELSDLGPGPNRVGFTYALGYVSPTGSLVGLRRPDPILGTDDRMALVADFPALGVALPGGPFSPHGRGQNVLFAGGHVAFSTSAGIGIDGDDVFRNASGRVGAGLYAADGCLGGPSAKP